MTIDNVDIRCYGTDIRCYATVISNDWKYCDNIVYYCDVARWSSDDYTISDSIKKMCRREWYNVAKAAGLSRKQLNIII